MGFSQYMLDSLFGYTVYCTPVGCNHEVGAFYFMYLHEYERNKNVLGIVLVEVGYVRGYK